MEMAIVHKLDQNSYATSLYKPLLSEYVLGGCGIYMQLPVALDSQ